MAPGLFLLRRRFRFVFAAALVALALAACSPKPVQLTGQTQGTTYHITLLPEADTPPSDWLQQKIEQRLGQIDRSLSNYRDDSELSRFNRAPVETWIDVGSDLYAVVKRSREISAQSDGAFDITVAPLVDLWGFGPAGRHDDIPSAAAIEAARSQVDYRQLDIDPARPRIRKLQPLSLDVNGIAQGYSVDALAELLAAAGVKNYLVEVGGELFLAGHNARGEPWRIGIEKPGDGVELSQQTLAGNAVGVTTAGDYHDYFECDGVRYSHTIDPRSGRPIAHKLAAVTVVADSAVLADGWDTALEVLGPERGFALAQRLHLAAYFIVRDGEHFDVRPTDAMRPYLR